jgi:predicted transcriptional regulator
MYRPKNDPFFEELKAEIQEGVDEIGRGEVVEEKDVWRTVYATIDQAARARAAAADDA